MIVKSSHLKDSFEAHLSLVWQSLQLLAVTLQCIGLNHRCLVDSVCSLSCISLFQGGPSNQYFYYNEYFFHFWKIHLCIWNLCIYWSARKQSSLLMRNIESRKSSISALKAFTIPMRNNIKTIWDFKGSTQEPKWIQFWTFAIEPLKWPPPFCIFDNVVKMVSKHFFLQKFDWFYLYCKYTVHAMNLKETCSLIFSFKQNLSPPFYDLIKKSHLAWIRKGASYYWFIGMTTA